MAGWLILFVGIIYLFIGIQMCYTGKVGLGLAFLGYAFANYGLYLAGTN